MCKPGADTGGNHGLVRAAVQMTPRDAQLEAHFLEWSFRCLFVWWLGDPISSRCRGPDKRLSGVTFTIALPSLETMQG